MNSLHQIFRRSLYFLACLLFVFPIVFKASTFDDCDNIILRNGDEVRAKVIEVQEELIKYRKCDNLSGPLYSVKKVDVYLVKYANGTKELMKEKNQDTQAAVITKTMSNNTPAPAEIEKPNDSDVLTNEKIIKLSKLGLQPTIIVSKIQTSETSFDVSTDALIRLSDNGVSADVISEMMKIDNKAKKAYASKLDIKDPNKWHKPGIYLYDPNDAENPVRQVDPSVASGIKSGGLGVALAQAYSSGIATNNLKSSLAGKFSRLQITNPNPVFYFYFESNNNPNNDDWFFATASSPNEFVLVRMEQSKSKRTLIVGSSNYYGSSSGIANKSIPYDYVKIADGIYKVTVKQPLKAAEYCFAYASSVPNRYSNDKVFDFGVPKPPTKGWKMND